MKQSGLVWKKLFEKVENNFAGDYKNAFFV
jgi:hypothetical protein